MAKPTEYIFWLLIPALIAVSAAASAQLQARPVTARDTSYEMDGYRVLAPPGKDWFELTRDRQNVYFGKKLASPTHSFIATAISTSVKARFDRPEAFRDHVAEQLAGAKGQRNTVIESRAEIDATLGLFCIRHYTKAEDRGAIYAKGRALMTETSGVSCLHPDHRDLTIDVSYTERGLPAETSAELRAEGDSFVRSLRFGAR